MNLRFYQSQSLTAVRDEFKQQASTLLVLPTGCGKTICFAHLIKHFVDSKLGRCLVLAHRDELINQAADKIYRVTGIRADIEKADQWADQQWQEWRSPVIVSSVQTQVSGQGGKGRMARFNPHDFALLIIDEAHHATSPTYRRIIDYYRNNPNLKILGVTATPNRADEEALGQVFGSCAFDYGILDAINDGWLVSITQAVKYLDHMDLSGIKTTAGDLNGAELAKVLEYEEVALPMADETFRVCANLKTLLFAGSVAQAHKLAEILNRYRPDCAAAVDGKTPQDQRRQLLRDFADGRFQFLCNCGVLTEGYDNPGIEAVVMARPTKSQPLYAQMIGRGTRPLPGTVDGIDDYEPQLHLGIEDGHTRQAAIRRQRIADSPKKELLVVDFVGNAGRHKLVSAADVLGGKYSDEVVAAAKKDAERNGKPADVAERLKAAQERLLREAADAERRRHIVASAKYTTRNVDPFGMLGITPTREPGWLKGKLPSEKMIALLQKNKIKTDDLSFHQAKQLIGALAERWEKGLPTPKQASCLARAGFNPEMNVKLARPIIDTLAKNGWRWPVGVPKPNFDGVMPSGADINVVEHARG